MKSLLKSTAVITALIVTASATAAPSQGQHLAECKQMINAQFTDVKRIKLTNLKDRRGTMTAKYKVLADDQRAIYTCTVEKGSDTPLVVRTDKVVQDVAGGQ